MLGVKGKNGTMKYTGTFSSEKIAFSFHIVSISHQGFSKFSMIVFFKKNICLYLKYNFKSSFTLNSLISIYLPVSLIPDYGAVFFISP